MNSLINNIKDINLQNLIMKFSHFSETSSNVFIHFYDANNDIGYSVAKKLHDGSKLQVDYDSSFCELFESIIENNKDVSLPKLESILLIEISKFNEARLESNKNLYKYELEKYSKLLAKYKDMNVFSTPTNKWDELIFTPLQKLIDNKIFRMDSELYIVAINLMESFFQYNDSKIKAMNYEKIIARFVDKVTFDPDGLKKSQKLFIENLTFEEATHLPEPKTENVFKMLFTRHQYQDKQDQFVLRSFKDISEMVQALS